MQIAHGLISKVINLTIILSLLTLVCCGSATGQVTSSSQSSSKTIQTTPSPNTQIAFNSSGLHIQSPKLCRDETVFLLLIASHMTSTKSNK